MPKQYPQQIRIIEHIVSFYCLSAPTSLSWKTITLMLTEVINFCCLYKWCVCVCVLAHLHARYICGKQLCRSQSSPFKFMWVLGDQTQVVRFMWQLTLATEPSRHPYLDGDMKDFSFLAGVPICYSTSQSLLWKFPSSLGRGSRVHLNVLRSEDTVVPPPVSDSPPNSHRQHAVPYPSVW